MESVLKVGFTRLPDFTMVSQLFTTFIGYLTHAYY